MTDPSSLNSLDCFLLLSNAPGAALQAKPVALGHALERRIAAAQVAGIVAAVTEQEHVALVTGAAHVADVLLALVILTLIPCMVVGSGAPGSKQPG